MEYPSASKLSSDVRRAFDLLLSEAGSEKTLAAGCRTAASLMGQYATPFAVGNEAGDHQSAYSAACLREAITAVITEMRRFPADAALQTDGCAAISAFAQAVSGDDDVVCGSGSPSCRRIRDAAAFAEVSRSAIGAVTAALARLPLVVSVQEPGLSALVSLLSLRRHSGDDGDADSTRATFLSLSADALCVAALVSHSSSAEVQMLGLAALAHMTRADAVACARAAAAGAVEAAVAALARFPTCHAVQLWACVVIENVCSGGAGGCESSARPGALRQLSSLSPSSSAASSATASNAAGACGGHRAGPPGVPASRRKKKQKAARRRTPAAAAVADSSGSSLERVQGGIPAEAEQQQHCGGAEGDSCRDGSSTRGGSDAASSSSRSPSDDCSAEIGETSPPSSAPRGRPAAVGARPPPQKSYLAACRRGVSGARGDGGATDASTTAAVSPQQQTREGPGEAAAREELSDRLRELQEADDCRICLSERRTHAMVPCGASTLLFFAPVRPTSPAYKRVSDAGVSLLWRARLL